MRIDCSCGISSCDDGVAGDGSYGGYHEKSDGSYGIIVAIIYFTNHNRSDIQSEILPTIYACG